MTYTVIARCPRRGELGVAIATYSLAVGGLCPQIASSIGAMSSQAFVNPELRPLAINLLSAGRPAASALDGTMQSDPLREFRQVGIIDREGRAAVFTGRSTRSYAGHQIGPDFAVFGNVLAGENVLGAMASAFENSAGHQLAERLVSSLEAGRRAGGQKGGSGPLPERSASVLVHGTREIAELDLRVDMHADAVGELRRLFDHYHPYVAYHRQRWLDPASAQPQEAFVAALAQQPSKR
ncbi:MAG: DUF1028 domain-containing protein [Bradyrhizobium sp.]